MPLTPQQLFRLGSNADLQTYLRERQDADIARLLRLDCAAAPEAVLDAVRKLQMQARLMRDLQDDADVAAKEVSR